MLTSRKNPTVQALRKAVRAGNVTPEGLLVIEGPHLLAEALRSSWAVQAVFATPHAVQNRADLLAGLLPNITELSPAALDTVSGVETSQGIIALVQPRLHDWRDLLGNTPLILILDGIQDPGNAGALVRSAEAFGASGVAFLSGTARVSNGKLLRSSAGSIFRLPFLENVSREDLVKKLRSARISIFALAANGTVDLHRADLKQGCALAVGNEGSGLSPEVLEAAVTLKIAAPRVESLNAAIAGSIALFEAARQRSAI